MNIKVCGISILSKKSFNVLGVIFDCKLQWSEHVAKTGSKNALIILPKYFGAKELMQLVASN
jgi:hypothetical protein